MSIYMFFLKKMFTGQFIGIGNFFLPNADICNGPEILYESGSTLQKCSVCSPINNFKYFKSVVYLSVDQAVERCSKRALLVKSAQSIFLCNRTWTTWIRSLSMWLPLWPQLYTPFKKEPACSAKPQTSALHSPTRPPVRGERNKAINKTTTISFLLFCEKAEIFSCVCVIISLSGSALSQGTEAVEPLPKPHSLSAHSQCYATANYFHSAPNKTVERKRERERERKEQSKKKVIKWNRQRGGGGEGQTRGQAGGKSKREREKL